VLGITSSATNEESVNIASGEDTGHYRVAELIIEARRSDMVPD
jgi:hypothetical protein